MRRCGGALLNKDQRKPFGGTVPFTYEQREELRRVFIDCASKQHTNPGDLFDERWPSIKAAALVCGRELAKEKFYRSGAADFTYSLAFDADALSVLQDTQSLFTVLHARLLVNKRVRQWRTSQRNRFRPLREAAKRGDVKWLLDKHPKQINALLYGAMSAGVAENYKDLARLTEPQLKAAVQGMARQGGR